MQVENMTLNFEKPSRTGTSDIQVLMYFNRGSLPWQGLKANSKKEWLGLSDLGHRWHSITMRYHEYHEWMMRLDQNGCLMN